MYRTTQSGNLIVAVLLGFVVVAAVIGFTTEWPPVSLVVGSLLLVVLFLFRSLTIEIDQSELRCFFGSGLIRRRFALAEITDAVAVRNKWYYGWGIRLTPRGWMFNVSGLDVVELTLASGKRFRIGTDRPEEVIRAIEQYQSSEESSGL